MIVGRLTMVNIFEIYLNFFLLVNIVNKNELNVLCKGNFCFLRASMLILKLLIKLQPSVAP